MDINLNITISFDCKQKNCCMKADEKPFECDVSNYHSPNNFRRELQNLKDAWIRFISDDRGNLK